MSKKGAGPRLLTAPAPSRRREPVQPGPSAPARRGCVSSSSKDLRTPMWPPTSSEYSKAAVGGCWPAVPCRRRPFRAPTRRRRGHPGTLWRRRRPGCFFRKELLGWEAADQAELPLSRSEGAWRGMKVSSSLDFPPLLSYPLLCSPFPLSPLLPSPLSLPRSLAPSLPPSLHPSILWSARWCPGAGPGAPHLAHGHQGVCVCLCLCLCLCL